MILITNDNVMAMRLTDESRLAWLGLLLLLLRLLND